MRNNRLRTHIGMRFTYGETVFLNAVMRGLRNAHFILKLYKPCGIVCPRREQAPTEVYPQTLEGVPIEVVPAEEGAEA
jgi:hypothetical protein